MNVFDDDWGPQDEDWSGGGGVSKRLVPGGGPFLGASVTELGPGNFVVYHAHHGSDELLLVLHGRPTLRTPDGETQLRPGDVAQFPPGPAGAHGMRNDTDEPARFVMFGTRVSPEVVEYPDLRQVTVQSRHGLFLIHDVEERAE